MAGDGSGWFVALLGVGGLWFYIKSLKEEIDSKTLKIFDLEKKNKYIKEKSDSDLSQIKILHKAEVEKFSLYISSLKDDIRKIESGLLLEKSRVAAAQKAADWAISINRDVLSKIRSSSVLLPGVVDFLSALEERIDNIDADVLVHKKRPALAASEEVRKAKAEARDWRKKARIYKNKISFYEASAPWLLELDDVSLDEANDGLNAVAEDMSLHDANGDPVQRYVTEIEWSKLTSSQRNQTALDRYFEFRQKNAFLAGLMYERFIGSLYEKSGYNVNYHGATRGFDDLGIDLVCEENGIYHIIQCKRFSVKKDRLVRENTVAQTYGAAMFFAYSKKIERNKVKAYIYTTHKISDEARRFADTLGVEVFESFELSRYPAIKCKIGRSGEKIYHLPFDQQYDATIVNSSKGDFYAETVDEAEREGFRRAYKWSGSR